jgi:hypothetical protein
MTMWPFGKSKDKKTHETIECIEKRIDGLIKSEHEARESAAYANAELAKANAKIAELQPQLRAQTEADLYFASAKIMRDIMETGKHAPEDRVRHAALLQSYQAQQRSGINQIGGAQYGYPQSLFGSIFGGR